MSPYTLDRPTNSFSQGLQFCHQLLEVGYVQRLQSVDQRLLRVGMNLNQKPVCTGCYGSLGNAGHVGEMPCSMAGVYDNGQMAETLDDAYRSDVHGEADAVLECPYAALTQYHLLIAFCQKVVGCGQPFRDGGGKPSLQQYGMSHLSQLLQKREVLHIARAYLQYIGGL